MSNLAKNVMTANPQCCSADTPLNEVAKLMVECDCGEIPVVDSAKKLVGVVTDRDIVCRAVAKDLNTALAKASEVMTSPVDLGRRRLLARRCAGDDGRASDPAGAGARCRRLCVRDHLAGRRRARKRRKARPASSSRKSRATQCTKSAAFSPIITQAACVVAFTTSGITDASAMRRPSTPRTRRLGSTTAAVSVAGPILHVPAGW